MSKRITSKTSDLDKAQGHAFNRTTDIFGRKLPGVFLHNGEIFRKGESVYLNDSRGIYGTFAGVYSGLAIVQWNSDDSTRTLPFGRIKRAAWMDRDDSDDAVR